MSFVKKKQLALTTMKKQSIKNIGDKWKRLSLRIKKLITTAIKAIRLKISTGEGSKYTKNNEKIINGKALDGNFNI